MGLNERVLQQYWTNLVVRSCRLTPVILRQIFKNWDSDKKVVLLPSVPGKKNLSEIAVPVGEFKHDLPSGPQKRKSNIKPERRAHATAWLEVECKTYGIKGIWRDGLGGIVDGLHVRFKDGVTKADAITKACINWYQVEKDRCNNYNTQVVVALARLQIIKFAEAGTSQKPQVPADLKVNGCLMPCRLISDDVPRIKSSLEELAEAMGKLDIGNE
ncbi:hypothetical protein FPOA_07084 [Fusarium poae]|uniref:Uncharacterized protein n=1 Tax=Fusarium poae TaxID=36050 RepID=A0A1B8AKA8_FUSPO|nr:hypothetical protein FPOA_07084 [Fusarium poae]